tara:strand:- start:78 stop:296 length:219 start_codon:yes stop_codon:yes gene_type:complete
MKLIIYFFISLTVFNSFSPFAKGEEKSNCGAIAQDPPTNLNTVLPETTKKEEGEGTVSTTVDGETPDKKEQP